MNILWNTLEKLDRAAFVTLDKVDTWLGRDNYRKRTEKAVEHVRAPQKAISFDG